MGLRSGELEPSLCVVGGGEATLMQTKLQEAGPDTSCVCCQPEPSILSSGSSFTAAFDDATVTRTDLATPQVQLQKRKSMTGPEF
ncbi:hypothetical protein CB1_000571007 [Camelus ferus]|nr:hypothetical protein CB1_000571007 [Camelus ferus]